MSTKDLQTKHTPAPWKQAHREKSDGFYDTEVFSETYGVIAVCSWTPQNLGNGVTGTYRVANARLIAAAPELLEALQDYLAQTSVFLDSSHAMVLAKVEAAIAKATGAPA